MSTLLDLQRRNLEKMESRDSEKMEPPDSPAPAETDILTSSQQDSKTDSNLAILTDDNQDGNQSSSPAVAPAEDDLDPVDRALLRKLARPYGDRAKEKSTLVSSRLPDDVVERLGLAADLVKKHKKSKQDVITRGLILAFEELVRGDGDVGWYE